MNLSVVIPAYNEEKRIGESLERIFEYLDGQTNQSEVIVVDDGSSDRTVEAVRRYDDRRLRLIINDQNRGKGYSVRRGMLAAELDLILFSDADLSTPIEDVERLARELLARDADGAIGSRAVPGANVAVSQPLYRVAMGKIFNACVRLIALGGYADTQCGFKLFTRAATREIFSRQTFSGFAFDVEILFIARLLGLQILELPVRWFNSPETKVSPALDSLRMLRDLVRIRLNAMLGRYGGRSP